jgi:SAM-dependent methyltransferase
MSSRAEAAIECLRAKVTDAWLARGGDPGSVAVSANIAYNTTDCLRRAAAIAAFAARAFDFSMDGKTVCELGCGFGGLCLHWSLDHGAGRILAVDQNPVHVAALRSIVHDFGIAEFAVVEDDLQAISGPEGQQDIVILNDVLYTANLVPDRVAGVCARLLRPGGIALFHHVNRAHGPEVASHRDGTQFLDPDAADRAARFATRGLGSTLAHRPLSPWGLAAYLRQAGFDDFRIAGELDGSQNGAPDRQGFGPRYVLACRKIGAGLPSFRRMSPSRVGMLDLQPYREAVHRVYDTIEAGARRLGAIFGPDLRAETTAAELRFYLLDRLLMDGLLSFRKQTQQAHLTAFAEAIDAALDHSLAAILTREAAWERSNFAAADTGGFRDVLGDCVRAARANFEQPPEPRYVARVDWEGAALRFAQSIFSGGTASRAQLGSVALRLRDLIGDRLRFNSVQLLSRTSDPLTGSVEAEYSEAAVDCIACEILANRGDVPDRPRVLYSQALLELIETIEAEIACSSAVQ